MASSLITDYAKTEVLQFLQIWTKRRVIDKGNNGCGSIIIKITEIKGDTIKYYALVNSKHLYLQTLTFTKLLDESMTREARLTFVEKGNLFMVGEKFYDGTSAINAFQAAKDAWDIEVEREKAAKEQEIKNKIEKLK